ncbi:PREDICTED: putative nuclease HARBI1 [Trachymyrmex cornetzi]|uniref:putative nuclease HARBI1 n=1 Tax=Trachymyrmex cornetzi TaxID=471704 RepID=UPI00084EEF84|nr:PREDICTED: putative nuclease HARBI1 [Trachymyrmex cornetzi]
MNIVTEKFKRIAGLDNVLGAIDGSYIEIPTPSIDAHCYLTRKCRYAVILQAVCDVDMRFIDCYAGYPGSVGDLRVFRNSDLWNCVNRNLQYFFPNQEFIIGNKAYPVLGWCLTAYKDNGHLTEVEINFNFILSQTRQIIEHDIDDEVENYIIENEQNREDNQECAQIENDDDNDEEGTAKPNYLATILFQSR